MHSNPLQCLTFSLLFLLPPLLLTGYWAATFPNPPGPVQVHPGLASIQPAAYPEDFYPGGAYVTLPHGRVRYWLLGPDNGKKIVLINGLSVPALIYHRVVPLLTKSNYRVLLYDLYGRGYSDAPQTTYDAALYATQLALLMQHVRWDSARVVGLSMGGGIAAYFTSTFPWLVHDKIALLASTGLIQSTDISNTVKFMSSPLVQAFAGTFIQRYLQRLKKSTDETLEPIRDIVRLQSAHLPGFNFAVASSLRDGPVRGLASPFRDLGRTGRRVLIIHGTHDRTVPYSYALEIQSLIREGAKASSSNAECKLLTLEGAGHELVLDRAEEVGAALIEWFADK